MLGRRPHSMIQTCLIVVLLLTMGYVLYINSSLGDQVQVLDRRAKLYQAQHQSLSSQLQVVHDERTRLEFSLRKEKSEHDTIKQELEQQKQSHEQTQDEMRLDHKRNYDILSQEYAAAKSELSRLESLLENVQLEKKSLESQHMINGDLKTLELEKSRVESEKLMLQDQVRKLYAEIQEAQQHSDERSSKLQQMQGELQNYQQLRLALLEAGSDVLKLDHPMLDTMSKENRMALFAHIGGGSYQHAQHLEENRLQLLRDQAERKAAIELQARKKEERDRLLAAANAQVLPNACRLPPQIGTCKEKIVRYYYDPKSSSCAWFFFSGCEGNTNNFESREKCQAYCGASIDFQKPDKLDLAYQPQAALQQGVEGGVKLEIEPPQSIDHGEQGNPVPPKIETSDHNNQQPIPQGNAGYLQVQNAQQVPDPQIEDNPAGGTVDKEEIIRADPADLMELEAREEEKRAQEEIEKLNKQTDQQVSEEETIEKFRQIQEEQQQVAEVQAEDLKLLAMQKFEKAKVSNDGEDNKININQEEGNHFLSDDAESRILKDNDQDSQVGQPPAVQVAAHPPILVLDLPGGQLNKNDEDDENDEKEDNNNFLNEKEDSLRDNNDIGDDNAARERPYEG